MDREHLHTKFARRLNRPCHRVGNVVQLEIEPDFCAGGQDRAHDFGAFGCVKLQSNFEKRDIATELIDKVERRIFRRHIQRHDDFVSGFCHSERSRGIPLNYRRGYNTGCLDFARHDN